MTKKLKLSEIVTDAGTQVRAGLNEANTGKAAEAIEKLWFETIAKLFPNKSNTDLKPHEWGKLKTEFADAIPM